MTVFASRAVVFLSVLSLAGCIPLGDPSDAVVRDLTESRESTTTIAIAKYVPVEATRFTVLCPYGTIERVEDDLGLHSTVIPDFSLIESRNAIIVSDGHSVISVLEFSVSEINLCPPGVSWHALNIGHPVTLSESVDGIWTVEADRFIGRTD